MYKYIFSFIFIPVLFIALATPAQATSKVQYYQTTSYSNANQQQQIAYLYAMIAQLQAQLSALQSYNPVIYPPYNNGSNNSTNEISRVVTGGVDSDGDDSVSMEGEITFKRDTEARVWFEYGTNTNLSYSTESIEIDGDSNDTEDFEITATDLDDNKTYYYRAVAEDDNGRYVEGVIKSFRFDGRDNDDDDNDGDWSIEVEDDYYETGDTVRVDYEVEDEDDKNWIGLFEVGEDDDDYVAYKYVKDEDGYVTFRIYDEGEYEFRLFDEDDDVQAESDEFEVED
jgi:hypothetical protein